VAPWLPSTYKNWNICSSDSAKRICITCDAYFPTRRSDPARRTRRSSSLNSLGQHPRGRQAVASWVVGHDKYEDFVGTYRVLVELYAVDVRGGDDAAAASAAIITRSLLEQVGADPADYRMGSTMVFLAGGLLDRLCKERGAEIARLRVEQLRRAAEERGEVLRREAAVAAAAAA
jgi:hypothetical protein